MNKIIKLALMAIMPITLAGCSIPVQDQVSLSITAPEEAIVGQATELSYEVILNEGAEIEGDNEIVMTIAKREELENGAEEKVILEEKFNNEDVSKTISFTPDGSFENGTYTLSLSIAEVLDEGTYFPEKTITKDIYIVRTFDDISLTLSPSSDIFKLGTVIDINYVIENTGEKDYTGDYQLNILYREASNENEAFIIAELPIEILKGETKKETYELTIDEIPANITDAYLILSISTTENAVIDGYATTETKIKFEE